MASFGRTKKYRLSLKGKLDKRVLPTQLGRLGISHIAGRYKTGIEPKKTFTRFMFEVVYTLNVKL
jgi:hypothetical protein